MSVGTVQVQGQPAVQPKVVYYTGTDTLPLGAALTYDPSAPDDGTKEGLGSAAIKPLTANFDYFAGIVTPRSANVTGPQFVEVYPPGSVQNDLISVLAGTGGISAGAALILINDEYGVTDGAGNVGRGAVAATAGNVGKMWTT